MDNFDLTDINLVLTGTVAYVGPAVFAEDMGSGGKIYTVTVNNVTGDGTIGIEVVGGHDITDVLSNPFSAPAGVIALYNIDQTVPTIVTVAPDITAADGGSYDISGTCSEDGDAIAVTITGATPAVQNLTC